VNRIIKVARMQLINKATFIGIPLLILASAFLVTLAIWWLVRRNGGDGVLYGGGAQAPMWYFLALGIQALTMTFPFSLGMSISRRSFYLGTVGLFSACALVLSVFYYLMGLVETATGGWGVDGRFFALQWIADNNWFVQIMFYFVLMILLFMMGFFSATIYLRWKTMGVLVLVVGLALILLAAATVITLSGNWVLIGRWMASLTAGSVTLLGTVLALALGSGSYATLRKAMA